MTNYSTECDLLDSHHHKVVCNILVILNHTKICQGLLLIFLGLGVSNLRDYLSRIGLLSKDRDCFIICTHNHFDHVGGAHHFDSVFIHEQDAGGLQNGRQTETLNYVKQSHFLRLPYPKFSARNYRVPPTYCKTLKAGQEIDIGGGHTLLIMHLPGHTKGSISIYYKEKSAIFVGDLLYECGSGDHLIDWLPTSSVTQFLDSANKMVSWLGDHRNVTIYPGHFKILDSGRAIELLKQYIKVKQGLCHKCCAGCLQCATFGYFLFGCFRCNC